MESTKIDFSKLDIPVVVKLVVMYEFAHKLIFKFPKHERYALGEKIENAILKCMKLVIFANNCPKFEKEKYLQKANVNNELLKILFRTALNCKMLEIRDYLDVEAKLQEIGKMTQGWIKYARNIK